MDSKDVKISVAGYVKLAKLWERNKEEALSYHKQYFKEMFDESMPYHIYDTYIDITGSKQTYKRPEMVRLLKDCVNGKIDVIISPTRAYLAANTEELCYLIKFIFDLNNHIEIITEDDDGGRVETVHMNGKLRKELYKMADTYVNLKQADYQEWQMKLKNAMAGLNNEK